MKAVAVVAARHLSGHKVEITFSDSKKQVVDFKPFLQKRPHPAYNQLNDVQKFKNFWIEDGNIVWDESWSFIFPEAALYNNALV